jgi:hypothetical protein
MRRLAASLIVTILGTACGSGGADRARVEPVIDTLPGGIVQVTNTAPTSWVDTNGWKLVLERTITPDAETDAEIGVGGGIVADSRGNIYVLDHKPIAIRMYGPDGKFVRTIGREGGGPGEFRAYGRLMITRDTLVHHDSRQARTQIFTADGEFIRGWQTMCCHSRPLLASSDGIVPIPGTIAPDTTVGADAAILTGAGVVRYHLDGTVVDTMIFPPEPEQPFWRMGDKNDWSINSIPFQPGLEARFMPSGMLAWGFEGTYRIVLSRTGIDSVRFFQYTAQPVALPESLRVQAVEEFYEEDERWRGVARLDEVPRHFPLWSSLTADGDNNIWVLLPGPKGEADHWDVFTADGVLLGTVPVPFSSEARTYWTSDRVYALDEGASGLPEITVWRITKP